MVQLNVIGTEWKEFTSTCGAFQKGWVRYHVMGIAIRRKVVKAPHSARTAEVVGQKPKRGRPKLLSKALF